MKQFFCILMWGFLLPMTGLAQEAEKEESGWESASEAVAHMGVGWNLGNTLECHSGDTLRMWMEADKGRSVSSYETMWGQKVTRASLFRMMKEAGFNAIRVPVTWYPHMEASFASVRGYDNGGTWMFTPWFPSKDGIGTRIQRAWMRRVRQVVDYVIGQGMYCILNVHHDTGEANTAWLMADEENYSQQHERFEAIWTQIAEEFRDYDEHLLFEGYNEMLDRERSWCFASFGAKGGYDAALASSAYKSINVYAQSFVDAVRATGGNNAERNLIVCTYGACDGRGSWNGHLQDPLKQMRLPKDVTEGHLIFEVHSYPDLSDLNKAKSEVAGMMVHLKNDLVCKGAPVIFGEWGSGGHDVTMEKRTAFAKFFAQRCRANRMGLFHWMGLSDGSSRTVPKWDEPEIVEAMMEGYYGEGGYEATGILPLETERGGTWPRGVYDLCGRCVAQTAAADFHPSRRGIYVVNGK